MGTDRATGQDEDFPSDEAEMSRRVVNVDTAGFKKKGMRYDWKAKVGTKFPDQRSPVVSSILFMPLAGEHTVEATTTWSMAWFPASVSSGIPLFFVNIQTEQIVTLVSVELAPGPRETRLGMDIKRTEEGFISIFSVTKGSAADCARLGRIHEKANATGHLLVISKLEGKSLMPSNACSEGLIHCCERSEIKEVLTAAIDTMDRIKIHIMGWLNQTRPNTSPAMGAAALCPNVHCSPPSLLKQ